MGPLLRPSRCVQQGLPRETPFRASRRSPSLCLPSSLSPTPPTHRLVTFGVIYGLLRRVHRYPICLKPTRSYPSTGGSSSMTLSQGLAYASPNVSSFNLSGLAGKGGGGGGEVSVAHRVQERMDGTHTMDEVACEFMRSAQELEELAGADDGLVVYVMK